MRKLRKGDCYAPKLTAPKRLDHRKERPELSSSRPCTPHDVVKKKEFVPFLRQMVYCAKLVILLIFSSYIFINSTQAQSVALKLQAKGKTIDGSAEIKPLEIGDTIPEGLWNMPLQVINHPEGKDTIRLHDYRDKKLIILDFWATWCGSCVASIDKFLNTSIYQNPDIFFQGVSFQSAKEISVFEQRLNKYFPSIIHGKVLSEYFPHRTIPHIILIKDNRVFGITGLEALTEENLASALNGESLAELTKIDVLDFDPTLEIYEQQNQVVRESILFQGTSLGPIVGLRSYGAYTIDSVSQNILIVNKTLIESMYLLLDNVWHNRIFFEVEDEGKLNYLAYNGSLSYGQWLNQYAVGIKAKAPHQVPRNDFFSDALSTLLAAHRYSIRVEERKLPCFVIMEGDGYLHEDSDLGIKLSRVIYSLNHQPTDKALRPIFLSDLLDSSDRQIVIDIKQKEDEAYLFKTFQSNGLKLVKEDRVVPVLVVSERRKL